MHHRRRQPTCAICTTHIFRFAIDRSIVERTWLLFVANAAKHLIEIEEKNEKKKWIFTQDFLSFRSRFLTKKREKKNGRRRRSPVRKDTPIVNLYIRISLKMHKHRAPEWADEKWKEEEKERERDLWDIDATTRIFFRHIFSSSAVDTLLSFCIKCKQYRLKWMTIPTRTRCDASSVE